MNVVITGAASGIGLALSSLYLQQGNTVIMVDKDHATLMQIVHELTQQFDNQVLHMTCDISQVDDVKNLALWTFEQVPQVDYLYNNAGIIGTLAPVWDLKSEQINQVLEVNVYGILHMIQAFLPLLLKQESKAHIINIASLYALCSGSQMAAYAMSKHAVLALSESLYFDLQHDNKPLDLSVAFPSFTDTALLTQNTSEGNTPFYKSLNSLLAHARPALEVAGDIIKEVEEKRFYILPDKEVKQYAEERLSSLLTQKEPHCNEIEKLLGALVRRKKPR